MSWWEVLAFGATGAAINVMGYWQGRRHGLAKARRENEARWRAAVDFAITGRKS